jgi:hypothetical protein
MALSWLCPKRLVFLTLKTCTWGRLPRLLCSSRRSRAHRSLRYCLAEQNRIMFVTEIRWCCLILIGYRVSRSAISIDAPVWHAHGCQTNDLFDCSNRQIYFLISQARYHNWWALVYRTEECASGLVVREIDGIGLMEWTGNMQDDRVRRRWKTTEKPVIIMSRWYIACLITT